MTKKEIKELAKELLSQMNTTPLEMGGGYKHTDVNELRKGLDWFRQNNSEAYMVLLD